MHIRIAAASLAAFAASAQAAPAHYDIHARLDPAHGSLEATTVVTLPADQAQGAQAFLLGDSYRVEQATSDAPAEVKVETVKEPFPGQRIQFRFKQPPTAPVTLTFRYGGPLAGSGEPPLNAISPERVELNVDSFWLPVHDDLATRFDADAEIEGIPADFVVVAPGQVSRSGGKLRIHRSTLDMDVALVAAPGLSCVRDGFELCARDLKSPLAEVYGKRGREALAFLTGWFGPMPNGAPKVVVVERPRNSGYARAGYVVVTSGSDAPEFRSAKFICHEFSHAWWSPANPATEDHWLTESLAEYTALRYVEQAFGKDKLDWFLDHKRQDAAQAPPVLGGGRRNDDVLYAKGPLLLFGLQERIGRAKMDAVMARLGRRPPRTTAAFLSVLGEVAGPDEARTFEADLRK